MHEVLELVEWHVHVLCWRAWRAVPTSYRFQPPVGGRQGASSSDLGATRRKDVAVIGGQVWLYERGPLVSQ